MGSWSDCAEAGGAEVLSERPVDLAVSAAAESAAALWRGAAAHAAVSFRPPKASLLERRAASLGQLRLGPSGGSPGPESPDRADERVVERRPPGRPAPRRRGRRVPTGTVHECRLRYGRAGT